MGAAESRWTGARKAELPPPGEWEAMRRETKALAGGRCEYRFPKGGRCREPGTDCDHIGDPHDHSVENRRWLCRRHHDLHTQQQSAAARRAILAKSRMPAERHPGLL